MKPVYFILWLISFCMLRAEDPLTILKPLLTDLPGWEALPASGFNSYRDGIKMINASRRYTSGSQTLQAVLLITNQTTGTGWLDSNMSLDFSGSTLRTEEIDGFKVFHLKQEKHRQMNIVIVIRQQEQDNIFLALRFKDVPEEKAWDIARAFDWSTISFMTQAL